MYLEKDENILRYKRNNKIYTHETIYEPYSNFLFYYKSHTHSIICKIMNTNIFRNKES